MLWIRCHPFLTNLIVIYYVCFIFYHIEVAGLQYNLNFVLFLKKDDFGKEK